MLALIPTRLSARTRLYGNSRIETRRREGARGLGGMRCQDIRSKRRGRELSMRRQGWRERVSIGTKQRRRCRCGCGRCRRTGGCATGRRTQDAGVQNSRNKEKRKARRSRMEEDGQTDGRERLCYSAVVRRRSRWWSSGRSSGTADGASQVLGTAATGSVRPRSLGQAHSVRIRGRSRGSRRR